MLGIFEKLRERVPQTFGAIRIHPGHGQRVSPVTGQHDADNIFMRVVPWQLQRQQIKFCSYFF